MEDPSTGSEKKAETNQAEFGQSAGRNQCSSKVPSGSQPNDGGQDGGRTRVTTPETETAQSVLFGGTETTSRRRDSDVSTSPEGTTTGDEDASRACSL